MIAITLQKNPFLYHTISKGLTSDEVGYPKTRNPGGKNPNPKNQTRPEPEEVIPEPDPKPDFQNPKPEGFFGLPKLLKKTIKMKTKF